MKPIRGVTANASRMQAYGTSAIQTKCRGPTISFAIGLCALLFLLSANANTQIVMPDDARLHGLESLKTVVENEGVPLPNNLNAFIKDRVESPRVLRRLFGLSHAANAV